MHACLNLLFLNCSHSTGNTVEGEGTEPNVTIILAPLLLPRSETWFIYMPLTFFWLHVLVKCARIKTRIIVVQWEIKKTEVKKHGYMKGWLKWTDTYLHLAVPADLSGFELLACLHLWYRPDLTFCSASWFPSLSWSAVTLWHSMSCEN